MNPDKVLNFCSLMTDGGSVPVFRPDVFRLRKLYMKVGFERFQYILDRFHERGALYEIPPNLDCDRTFLRCLEEVNFVDNVQRKFENPRCL